MTRASLFSDLMRSETRWRLAKTPQHRSRNIPASGLAKSRRFRNEQAVPRARKLWCPPTYVNKGNFMSYLVPSEFVTKMVDAGESKIFMSTRDTVIRAYMA